MLAVTEIPSPILQKIVLDELVKMENDV